MNSKKFSFLNEVTRRPSSLLLFQYWFIQELAKKYRASEFRDG